MKIIHSNLPKEVKCFCGCVFSANSDDLSFIVPSEADLICAEKFERINELLYAKRFAKCPECGRNIYIDRYKISQNEVRPSTEYDKERAELTVYKWKLFRRIEKLTVPLYCPMYKSNECKKCKTETGNCDGCEAYKGCAGCTNKKCRGKTAVKLQQWNVKRDMIDIVWVNENENISESR